jgi:uncharacterized protein
MVKPRGALCNLACDYCYYLAKADLYPQSGLRMSEGTLESYVRQYLATNFTPEVTFAWQGGEPTLMGLDFYRLAVGLQRKHARPGVRVLNTLQTNGTTLDDDWCAFLRANEFLVGISIDGPRDLHDANRKDRGGHATFDSVMRGLRLLRKHSVPFNILATVNQANADHPRRVYRFLRDVAGARFIQFIPIVERIQPDPGLTPWAVSPRSVQGEQFGRFLTGVFDEWVRRDVGSVFVQAFDEALAAYSGGRPSLCVHQETCGTALVLEHNGDVYSCDHFVDRRHLLGNLVTSDLQSLVASRQQRSFGQGKWTTLPRACRDCDVRFACNGGCPKDRFVREGGEEQGENYLCEGYRLFFRHVREPMAMMAEELAAGRAPRNVMRQLRSAAAKPRKRTHGAGQDRAS